jgi:hypothetical protein
VDLLVASTTGGAQTAITSDPMPHLPEARQLFGVDMDHLPGPLPLVAANRRPGLQVPQMAVAERLEQPAHGGEGRLQRAGDSEQGAALVP